MQYQQTLSSILDCVNRYSNLVLVLITAVYAFLTWRMVREMRIAREEQSEPHLVAVLVPLGPKSVKLRIRNAGPGPAVRIEGTIRPDPAVESETRIWRHPVLIPGDFEDFSPPGRLFNFEQLAAKYDKVFFDVTYSTSFGRARNAHMEINLKLQLEGWYNAGILLAPRDLPGRVEELRQELSEIKSELRSLTSELRSDRVTREMADEVRDASS